MSQKLLIQVINKEEVLASALICVNGDLTHHAIETSKKVLSSYNKVMRSQEGNRNKAIKLLKAAGVSSDAIAIQTDEISDQCDDADVTVAVNLNDKTIKFDAYCLYPKDVYVSLTKIAESDYRSIPERMVNGLQYMPFIDFFSLSECLEEDKPFRIKGTNLVAFAI